MKILFIVYHGLSSYSGISKKIIYQVKGFKELGHEVFLYTYDYDDRGNKVRKINNVLVENLGKSFFAPLKARIDYSPIIQFIKDNHIEFVYARSFNNANPFTIHLFSTIKKLKIKSVIEIPTYPYDMEYKVAPLHTKIEQSINKLFRMKLAQETDAIVTFSNELCIWRQKTIRISNGIDFESIQLKRDKNNMTNEVHLIGVAEVHFWHGYDRIIAGIGEYYKNRQKINIYFHIVGGISDSEMLGLNNYPGFKQLVEKYNIENNIIFHGQLYGNALDELFDKCDFAIGSLGRHRCNIKYIKTLKNREYAARGIPFIYSEIDDDFENKPYILKAPDNDNSINIQEIIDFLNKRKFHPEEIRKSIEQLSWKNQLKKVIDTILN